MNTKKSLIRNKRRALDLSQEYIAFELGISQKAFSDIENGKTKLTSIMLSNISKILNVKPSDICPILDECKCINDTEDKIRRYLKKNNIELPHDLQ